MKLRHFEAMLLFAAVISVVFAFLSKRTGRDRLRYAIWSFVAFLLIAVALAWLMYPYPH
jgi:cytochrome bd-type quinol oxidase subunit 2